MKNFNFNLLQYLNNKKAEKGFTLIELLVVIIIIGILSAIALPAFLNQANKARQSEAKQALGAVNRGQQAYYLERQMFSENIDGLGLGLSVATENYSYGSANTAPMDPATELGFTAGGGADTAGTSFAEGNKTTRQGFNGYGSYTAVYAVAANQDAVRDYMGVAYLLPSSASQESTTQALLCEEQSVNANSGQVNHVGGTNDFLGLTATSDVQCPTYALNAQNVGQ